MNQWESSNFREFNTWCQIAGAIIKIGCETYNLEGSYSGKKTKTELCNLTISIPSHGVNDISVQGFGPNKKEAKKNAYKMIIEQLTANGLIKIGLRNQEICLNKSLSFLNQSQSQIEKNSESSSKNKKNKKILNKRIIKFVAKMQSSLRVNDFKTACLCLCHLSEINAFQWKNVILFN